MSKRENKKEKKQAYIDRLCALLETHPKFLLISNDNVGANQLTEIRKGIRGKGEIVFGKNSLMKRAIREVAKSNAALQPVLEKITGNVGLLFTNEDVSDIMDMIDEYKVRKEAKKGAISPDDVWVPKGPTSCEPTKTSFFQALEIPTKISRGSVEVTAPRKIVSKGEKVGNSEANILKMLGIKPFLYGLVVLKVYDNGSIYDPEVLKLSDGDIIGMLMKGITKVASVSMECGILNEASLPHMFTKSIKNVLSIPVETEFKYTFDEAKSVEEFIKDPSKFAAAAPKEEVKEEETKEEEEEEEEDSDDGDMGLGLFGGDDDDDDSDDDDDE